MTSRTRQSLVRDVNLLMRIVITCGPSFEPIDSVRRLTNASTGALGACLAEAFASRGFAVDCFKASGATVQGPAPTPAIRLIRFDTNSDLLQALRRLSAAGGVVDALLHAAALCDYQVASIAGDDGPIGEREKIETKDGAITLRLEPAMKVLPHLRALFPRTFIVGWKYEVAGTRESAVARAMDQIKVCQIDACVVNGPAFGPGFGFCADGQAVEESDTRMELARCLENRIVKSNTRV